MQRLPAACGFLCLLILLCVSQGFAPSASTIGSVERLHPTLDSLLAKEVKIEKLAEGFDWSEGPVWVKSGKYLLFSDVPRNVILRWQEGTPVKEYLDRSGYTGASRLSKEPGSNGLTIDREGRLIICQHGDRQISRIEKDGRRTVLVSAYEGKRFNSPNDLVYNAAGDLYFTDPPYGLDKLNDDPAKELAFNGVYRLSADGRLSLLTREMTFPNGIALSPDEKTLYVANSDPNRALWMAFEIRRDGSLGPGRVFFDATPWVKSLPGLPDGMKVDRQGNLWATGPGGVNIFSPAGLHLGRLNTGQATANCGWGDEGSTLYITADMYLCRVKTKTRGLVF